LKSTDKIETTKFNNAKGIVDSCLDTRCEYDFFHDIDKGFEYCEAPRIVKGEDSQNFIGDKYRTGAEIVMKNEDEYKRNKKSTNALLWKH
jgi:hypothetical protein